MTSMPPEGTKDDTLHFLKSGGIRSMFLWKDAVWHSGESYATVTTMDRIGWQYSHPALPNGDRGSAA